MTSSKDPRDDIYKDIDEALKSGDSKRLIKALKDAVLRTEEDMDKGREELRSNMAELLKSVLQPLKSCLLPARRSMLCGRSTDFRSKTAL